MDEGGEQDDLQRLADGLREAQRLLGNQPPEARKALQDRLIAVTNAAKHDTSTALRRLERLLTELRGAGGSGG